MLGLLFVTAAREFRGVLEDMEQDASDFAANTQVLESLTLDAVSFEVWP